MHKEFTGASNDWKIFHSESFSSEEMALQKECELQ